jgi:hypothetical protein
VRITLAVAVPVASPAPPAGGISDAALVSGTTSRKILLQADPEIRGRLDDAADMRDFDATILVADDLGLPPHATARHDGERVELSLSLQGLGPVIGRIVDDLKRVTRRAVDEDKLALNSELVTRSLYGLANNGRLLYNALPKFLKEPATRRIQVVTRSETYFPAEFVYDGPAPRDKAELCGHSSEYLALKPDDFATQNGCSACPNHNSNLHFCPLRFWGLNRTIERHSSNSAASADVKIKTQGSRPSPARTPFGSFAPLLHGVANIAYDFASRADLVPELDKTLKDLAGDNVALDRNGWGLWREAAGKANPKVFVAIPHSEESMNVDVLELGADDRLNKAEIEAGDLMGGGAEPRLLLLLGCSVAEPKTLFATYPAEFRAAGADIVIAPLAPILGADSVPIATEIARVLKETTSGARRTLGELMGIVRRKLLLEGHPGVLGVVAYGDADWFFG